MLGVLGYSLTQNIGDDIQTLAAMQLFPEFQVFVNRDMTEMVYDRNGNVMTRIPQEISTIFNCYFAEPRNIWSRTPGSPIIFSDFNPKVTMIASGLHFSPNLPVEKYVPQLQKCKKICGRVSCRSKVTAEKINKLLGEDSAFFMGCMTSLLAIPSGVTKTNVVLCVDVPIATAKKCMIDEGHDISGLRFESATAIHKKLINMPILQRLDCAMEQLRKYASARKVYTSRLHCFLPCRSMKVDVKLITNGITGADLKRISDFAAMSDAEFAEEQNMVKRYVTYLRNILNLPVNNNIFEFPAIVRPIASNVSSLVHKKLISVNVLIATIGRRGLLKILQSLKHQLLPIDHLTIVFDAKDIDNVFPEVTKLTQKFLCSVNIYKEQECLGHWGHGIRTKYRTLLKPRDIVLHADDDDAYTENALEIIRSHCGSVPDINKHLFVFQMKRKNEVFWKTQQLRVNNVGTPCGAIPYNINKLIEWNPIRGGDGEFYVKCGTLVDEVHFIPKIIYNVRS